MFTIEHEFDATVITLIDQGAAPLCEDVKIQLFSEQVIIEQYNSQTDQMNKVILSPEQINDLAASLNLPEGAYQLKPYKDP
ncbi:MAG: hypothetical protein OXC62_06000 [Aestuariivita sp.]|nr:hypothetical protein [Aestuariivita sp.]